MTTHRNHTTQTAPMNAKTHGLTPNEQHASPGGGARHYMPRGEGPMPALTGFAQKGRPRKAAGAGPKSCTSNTRIGAPPNQPAPMHLYAEREHLYNVNLAITRLLTLRDLHLLDASINIKSSVSPTSR
jgi:hypothetical protein